MRARDVVGRTIVKVNQHRFWNENAGKMDVNVDSFELDNGTVVWPVTIETDAEYGHEFAVWKPGRKRA